MNERQQEQRRAGCRRSTPAQIIRNSEGLSLQVGARELARQVGAEVALLDDLVEVGERLALGDEVADGPPGRSARPCLVAAAGEA